MKADNNKTFVDYYEWLFMQYATGEKSRDDVRTCLGAEEKRVNRLDNISIVDKLKPFTKLKLFEQLWEEEDSRK